MITVRDGGSAIARGAVLSNAPKHFARDHRAVVVRGRSQRSTDE
jgi:hypothetical protein